MTTEMKDAVGRLSAAVAEALDNGPHSGAKWNSLRSELMAIFGLPSAAVRCGLISKKKNVTNRTQKDVAWQNPRVLAVVVEPDGEVPVADVERALNGFAAKYTLTHDDVPRLRVCLLFVGTELVKVIRFHRAEAKVAGATVAATDDSADEGED